MNLSFDISDTGAPLILIVEDDPGIRTLLMRSLRENGFRTLSASSGPEMTRCLENNTVDLVLLDIMLPGMNGLDICRALRRVSDVAIIILSARGEEADRLIGLELGADDYIVKPFSPRELVARIRATLRRSMRTMTPTAELPREDLRFAGWTLDPGRRELVSPEGSHVELSGAEFDLLLAFVSQPQRVIGRERLLELSRARLADASDRSIDVLVSRLRRKLSRDDDKPPIIRTIRGIGYMFSPLVERA